MSADLQFMLGISAIVFAYWVGKALYALAENDKNE